MVILADTNCKDINNKFNDDAYKSAHYYSHGEYTKAVEQTYNILKKCFSNTFNQNIEFEFKMNRSIEDMEHISIDANNLDYNDYYELATFTNKNENYVADIIVYNGEFGLRYSKIVDDGIENLTFQRSDLDLTNDVTLMLSMKNKLNDFIDSELIYDIEISSNIKV